MDTERWRVVALGFFSGAAASFLSTLVSPAWLAVAVVVGLALLFGGLGSYLVYLIRDLSESAGVTVEEPGTDHRPS